MRERRRSPDRTGQAQADPVSADDGSVPDGQDPSGTDPEGKARDKLESRARNLVLRMLTHSPRTRAQLERSLYRREYPDEVVESVLNGLDEAGLVDDEAFARAWVSSRQHSRHLSRRALSRELRTRGVEEETVREAVAEVSDEDEQDGARSLARKSLRGSRNKDEEARIRRALGALGRKGYPGGLAYRIVREELEREGLDVDLPDPEF
ncbi:regulatory protein RecX [Nocardiopsis nanhaiensis]